MDKSIPIAIGDYRIEVPIEEAIMIRDSLCSRLGCPSFCCDEVKADAIDDKVISFRTVNLVSDANVA